MPFLNLRTAKGLLNDEQKQYLMDKFTDLLVEVEGGGNPEFKKVVWILIEEHEPEKWQIGDRRSTQEAVTAYVRQRDANRKK
jgi:4-oxalocrotonate tautomerase